MDFGRSEIAGQRIMEDCMAVTTATKVASSRRAPDEEIEQVWRTYKADMTNKDLRNRLVERYLPLVKYNGERIWARLA